MITVSVPGKIILVGEHAVVYGTPAIAVPVTQVSATASFEMSRQPLQIILPDIEEEYRLLDLPTNHPAALPVYLTAEYFGTPLPTGQLTVSSTIPMGAGLGSSAAISAAIIRVLAKQAGQLISAAQVSALTFEAEKVHHGTPSGIDNTVVAYAQPVYFVRGLALEVLPVMAPFTLVIGDTGIEASTRTAVEHVRKQREANPDFFDVLFAEVAELAQQAYSHIVNGNSALLGPLLEQNHGILQQMGVSSPELDTLVHAAMDAGALGAKMSGGGLGGNMLALVERDQAKAVAGALEMAGATRTIITHISPIPGSL